MRNLPFAAQLILQEMRHYRLILKLEEMNLPDLDTDAYMIGMCDTVAALLGLPAQRPEAWENTYTLYVDEVKRFDISDRPGLEAWALQCYEALRILAEGMKQAWQTNLGLPCTGS